MLECNKMLRLPRKTAVQHVLKRSKRKCLPASPIDTATALHRKPATRDGASKGTFRARLPYISNFAASKSTSFAHEFTTKTSKSTFCEKVPSNFITCHKMSRLPQNLHLVTTSRSADNAIREKHATGHVQSVAPATKNATHLLKAT